MGAVPFSVEAGVHLGRAGKCRTLLYYECIPAEIRDPRKPPAAALTQKLVTWSTS